MPGLFDPLAIRDLEKNPNSKFRSSNDDLLENAEKDDRERL